MVGVQISDIFEYLELGARNNIYCIEPSGFFFFYKSIQVVLNEVSGRDIHMKCEQ